MTLNEILSKIYSPRVIKKNERTVELVIFWIKITSLK